MSVNLPWFKPIEFPHAIVPDCSENDFVTVPADGQDSSQTPKQETTSSIVPESSMQLSDSLNSSAFKSGSGSLNSSENSDIGLGVFGSGDNNSVAEKEKSSISYLGAFELNAKKVEHAYDLASEAHSLFQAWKKYQYQSQDELTKNLEKLLSCTQKERKQRNKELQSGNALALADDALKKAEETKIIRQLILGSKENSMQIEQLKKQLTSALEHYKAEIDADRHLLDLLKTRIAENSKRYEEMTKDLEGKSETEEFSENSTQKQQEPMKKV